MKAKKILTAVICLCITAQMSGYIQPVFNAKANSNVVVEKPVEIQYYDIFQYKNLGNYIEIVATSSMAKGVIEVPSEIDGLPVKTAGEHAFAGNQNITSIRLPDTLTSIGKGAFWGDTALTSVTIPEGVTQIKDETFLNCMSLLYVSLPDTLKSIGVRAFYNCNSITSIKIPNSVNEIDSQAFDSCRQLNSVNIPNGVTTLEEGTFSNCDFLYALNLPESVEKICKNSLPSPLFTVAITINNPDCEIEPLAVFGNPSNCTIISSENSKVQEQAETYGYNFSAKKGIIDPGTLIEGDANNDGLFSVADIVTFQNYLVNNGKLSNWQAVDYNNDLVLDAFDLCLMRKAIIPTLSTPVIDDPIIQSSPVNLTADIKSAEVEGKNADETFINGQTDFALELFKNTVSDNKNVLVSPYSIVQALAMTGNGADGVTKEEMENVIGGGIDFDELNKYLYTQRTSQPNSENCKLLTANSIWSREGAINPYPEFLQNVVDYYGAEVFKAPFDDSTVNDINNWVDTNTDHMIPGVISGEIPPDVLMYLINAVTFDAKWSSPYYENDVWEHDFTNYNGTVQQAEMMFSEGYSYLEDENATGFYKDYEGGRYAFAALLPNEDITVTEYVNSLTSESLHNILANPQKDYIRTGLPKFSYDYSTETKELVNILSDMGMQSAFVTENANFSKLSSSTLYISEIIHKTHIEVSEEGTKAAAVTVVEEATDAFHPEPEKEIIFDRPFVYCIVDTETYLPVFMGTLMNIE